LEDKWQLVIITTNKVIASETCGSIDDEVELLSIKHKVLILDGLSFLRLISDNKCHVRKRGRDVLIEKDPVMVDVVKPVSFIIVKLIIIWIFDSFDIEAL
jgi:hypothetical protein